MPVESFPAPTRDVSTETASITQPVIPGFEERWAAWQAKGAAHDRAVRRRFAIVAPILAVVTAIVYAWLIR